MKILDVLPKEAILSDLKSLDKKGVIEELVIPVAGIAGVNKEEIVRVLMERERLGSTGIGEGIGIPHGKMKDLKSLVVSFGLSRQGVDFESIDGRPAHIFFLLVTPENSTGLHLKLLAPPTSAPSISGMAISSEILPGFTLPPYSILMELESLSPNSFSIKERKNK